MQNLQFPVYVSKLKVMTHLRVWYLAEVGVQVYHTVAEFLHILCQQLVSIGYPVVQVSHFVVRETSVRAKGEDPNKSENAQNNAYQKTGRESSSSCSRTYCRYWSYKLFVSLSRNLSFSSLRPSLRKLFTKAIWNEPVTHITYMNRIKRLLLQLSFQLEAQGRK